MEKYVSPTMEIIEFDDEDVIATSPTNQLEDNLNTIKGKDLSDIIGF